MAFNRYLPGWLYEALPYIYALAGIFVMFSLKGGAAVLSGSLLISAGFIVWKIRRNHRERAQSDQRISDRNVARTLFEDDADDKAGLVQVMWHPSFEVGHELIDRQHRRLFSLGNQLINALMSRQSKGDIELMLSELVNEISEHFRSEEEIMASFDNPLSEEHKGIHSSLLVQITELHSRFEKGTVSVSELVGFIAYDVVAQHIIKEDLKFSPACKPALAN